MKLCILASSSMGNAVFVRTGATRLLIDCGLNYGELVKRLAAIDEHPRDLAAVLVTHEHQDHVSGLPMLVKKSRLRLLTHATEGTAGGIDWGDVPATAVLFSAGATFRIGDIDVQTVPISHDAAGPVGFTLAAGGVKVGLFTDLGYISEEVAAATQGCRLLCLESNYDVDMMMAGPYPWSIKRRILGRGGHLANDDVATFIKEGMDPGLETLVLYHVSRACNTDALAGLSAWEALKERGICPRLVVADPDDQSKVFEL